MVDDAELLRRYSETHSESAFTELVGRHLNLVYFTALRATGGDMALAQDVAQAVFAIAARRARTLSTHATLTGWLYTTTRFTAARARRKEQTRRRYQKEAAIHHMITGGPDHEWERLRPIIDEALGEMDAREREAILLRFFEGRPFADIGDMWRISHDAARMRVDRALEKLRGALARRGISSVSAALATALATQSGLAAPAGMVASVSTAAFVPAAAPSSVAALLGIMSGSKIIIGTATVVVTLATSIAVLKHNRAERAELRVVETTRELAAARAKLAVAERRQSVAETVAAEADKDSGTLLAAVEAARAKLAVPPTPSPAAPGSIPPFSTDPLAHTLQALFPNGVVAVLGDRIITVDDVRRQIVPLLPKARQMARNQSELRTLIYALQNSAIADLVGRQLDVKEFHNQIEGDAPKHIAPEMIDNVIADRVRNEFNNDQGAFVASLKAQGMTLARYRQAVEEDMIHGYMRNQQRKLIPAKDSQVKPPSP